MPGPVTRAVDPAQDAEISRELLARMDEAATGREHWKILLTSGMGFFTDAYDLFIIGVVAAMIVNEWQIPSYQKSLLTSLALLTSAAGAILFGHVADKFGRRKIYGYEVLVLAGGAIASAFAPGIWWLIAFRAILGFGIGGDYPVSATIMSEYAARRHRGRMVALARSRRWRCSGYAARSGKRRGSCSPRWRPAKPPQRPPAPARPPACAACWPNGGCCAG